MFMEMWNKGAAIAKLQKLGVEKPRAMLARALIKNTSGRMIFGSNLSAILPICIVVKIDKMHPERP